MEERHHFLNTYYSPSTLLDILFLIQKWQILASMLSLPIQGRSLWSILPFSNNMDYQKVLVKVALQEAIAFQSLWGNRLNETICHPLMNSESIHKGHVGVLWGWTNILAQRIFLFFPEISRPECNYGSDSPTPISMNYSTLPPPHPWPGQLEFCE